MIKATFKLTKAQKEAIAPLAEAMKTAGAILGQCWVEPTNRRYGEADFVDKAIKEAFKLGG